MTETYPGTTDDWRACGSYSVTPTTPPDWNSGMCSMEDLLRALEIAVEALCQYRDGKTWPHIASDALEEIDKVMEGGSK